MTSRRRNSGTVRLGRPLTQREQEIMQDVPQTIAAEMMAGSAPSRTLLGETMPDGQVYQAGPNTFYIAGCGAGPYTNRDTAERYARSWLRDRQRQQQEEEREVYFWQDHPPPDPRQTRDGVVYSCESALGNMVFKVSGLPNRNYASLPEAEAGSRLLFVKRRAEQAGETPCVVVGQVYQSEEGAWTFCNGGLDPQVATFHDWATADMASRAFLAALGLGADVELAIYRRILVQAARDHDRITQGLPPRRVGLRHVRGERVVVSYFDETHDVVSEELESTIHSTLSSAETDVALSPQVVAEQDSTWNPVLRVCEQIRDRLRVLVAPGLDVKLSEATTRLHHSLTVYYSNLLAVDSLLRMLSDDPAIPYDVCKCYEMLVTLGNWTGCPNPDELRTLHAVITPRVLRTAQGSKWSLTPPQPVVPSQLRPGTEPTYRRIRRT